MADNPDAKLIPLPGQWPLPGPEPDWRQLYWAEVRLRRTEAERAEAAIAELQAQLRDLQAPPPALPLTPEQHAQLQQEVAGYPTVAELKTRFLEVLRDRQRLLAQVQELRQALATEQEAHAQTRQSLTTSLTDVIESLVQGREGNPD